MEALERLQSVNATLRLMREHDLCSNGSDDGSISEMAADRFMADFFIFLAQRSANAEEIKDKCESLVKTLPKVSFTFSQALVAENHTLVQSTRSKSILKKALPSPIAVYTSSHDDKGSTMLFMSDNIHVSQLHSRKNPPQLASEQRLLITNPVPLVGLRAMERASTTLEDFCRSYFMFHEMEVHNPQQLFQYLPILSFVEAFIYQLDEENEEQVRAHNSGTVPFLFPSTNQDFQADAHALGNSNTQDAAHSKTCTGEQYCVRDSSSVNRLGAQPFEGLQHALADKGLLSERINSELRDGLKYWRLEHALCEAITNGAQIVAEDVFTAIKLKSFDYRVLNLLLYSLTGREVNEAHFDFLAVSELLVEISDDLYDYEDDVLKNSFNILRMLVKGCGPTRAPEVLAKLICDEEVRYQQLLGGLEPSLAKHYQERCTDATHEGGGGSKYQFGSWTIPPLIVDEENFRTQMHATSSP